MNAGLFPAVIGSLISVGGGIWVRHATQRSDKALAAYKASQEKEAESQKTVGDAYVKAQGIYDAVVDELRQEVQRLSADNTQLRMQMATMFREFDRMRILLAKNGISYDEPETK